MSFWINIDRQKLPIEYPREEMLRIYARRLGIVLLIAFANYLILFALLYPLITLPLAVLLVTYFVVRYQITNPKPEIQSRPERAQTAENRTSAQVIDPREEAQTRSRDFFVYKSPKAPLLLQRDYWKEYQKISATLEERTVEERALNTSLTEEQKREIRSCVGQIMQKTGKKEGNIYDELANAIQEQNRGKITIPTLNYELAIRLLNNRIEKLKKKEEEVEGWFSARVEELTNQDENLEEKEEGMEGWFSARVEELANQIEKLAAKEMEGELTNQDENLEETEKEKSQQTKENE